MEVEVTDRVVVDGIWLEKGGRYDIPPHRAKELFDADRAKPARNKPAETATVEADEDGMKRTRGRGRRAK